MEGGSVELAARAAGGHSLYVAPTLAYVGWTYTPLYYLLAAGRGQAHRDRVPPAASRLAARLARRDGGLAAAIRGAGGDSSRRAARRRAVRRHLPAVGRVDGHRPRRLAVCRPQPDHDRRRRPRAPRPRRAGRRRTRLRRLLHQAERAHRARPCARRPRAAPSAGGPGRPRPARQPRRDFDPRARCRHRRVVRLLRHRRAHPPASGRHRLVGVLAPGPARALWPTLGRRRWSLEPCTAADRPPWPTLSRPPPD